MDQSTVGSTQLVDAQDDSHRSLPNEVSTCQLCGGNQTVHFMTAPDRFHWRPNEYTLMRCSTCSYVWLASPPKPDEMWFHYSEDYHRVIMAAGEKSAASVWQRQRDVIAGHKKGGAILDVGCSSGGFLGTMKDGSWKLYGIEMEASTAEKARAATGAEIFVGDVLAAPFPAESFDVITGFDLLEHVYYPRQFLAKVWEWLKPGGIVYFRVPNIDSWEARMLSTYWYGLELPRHISHFSPKSLKHVMDSLGFQETELKTPRTAYIEHSAGYIYSAMAQKVGISVVSMSKRGPRSIPMRLVRKAFQLSLVVPFSQIASMAGAGPSIEAVFEKPVSNPDKTTGISGGKA